jgi:hypothetical protein
VNRNTLGSGTPIVFSYGIIIKEMPGGSTTLAGHFLFFKTIRK